MNYVYIERLQKLVNLLRDDAKKKKGIKFDLNFWGVSAKKAKKLPLSCGTTACAMGLAAISGIFKDEGLEYTTPSFASMKGKKGFFIQPSFNGHHGFDAAAELFGISQNEARLLFDPAFYDDNEKKGAKGERAVAQRIAVFMLFKNKTKR